MIVRTASPIHAVSYTDDELVGSFCIRTTEFEMLVEVLHECTGSSNPHQIVIDPRGSGKTSLLLRVAAELRRDPGLAAAFFPVVFAEESYEVSTAPGETRSTSPSSSGCGTIGVRDPNPG